jgi:hypothetical protein
VEYRQQPIPAHSSGAPDRTPVAAQIGRGATLPRLLEALWIVLLAMFLATMLTTALPPKLLDPLSDVNH